MKRKRKREAWDFTTLRKKKNPSDFSDMKAKVIETQMCWISSSLCQFQSLTLPGTGTSQHISVGKWDFVPHIATAQHSHCLSVPHRNSSQGRLRVPDGLGQPRVGGHLRHRQGSASRAGCRKTGRFHSAFVLFAAIKFFRAR